MRLCQLQKMEVINVCDGERISYPEDLIFDLKSGKIQAIIVPGPCKLFGTLGREKEFVIPVCQICRVGREVILVEIEKEKCLQKIQDVL